VSHLEILHACVLTVLAAVLVQTLLNVRTLPRLGSSTRPAYCPRVAVLVPARNEAARIAETIQAWCGQEYPHFTLLVYDDASDDGTAAIAAAAAAGRARVICGHALPAGWRGKPHACHRLREHTDAEILVFADADVIPAPTALRAAVAMLALLSAAGVSALPRHAGGVWMRAVVGVQNWAPLAFVPLWLARWARRPLFAVTNGQFIAIRADAYDRAGGFAAVRTELGEDAALGRRLAALGDPVRLVDGSGVLTCRAYEAFSDCWQANVRNLQTAFLGSSALLLGCTATLTAVTVAPVAMLIGGLVSPPTSVAWTWLPVLEIVLALGSRLVVDVRAGHAGWSTLLHSLAVVALFGMALDAVRRSAFAGSVMWRGRCYRLDISRD
jgi:chlorobactene glucosyltransferase